MIYKALDIAKYIINYEQSKRRGVSNLRLQKLLYFVQAKILVEKGDPCFEENIEAWNYGPVVPCVYHTYKFFGAWNLVECDSHLQKIDTKDYINSILESCSEYTTGQLVEITHDQKPWKEAIKKGLGTVIKNEAIKEYFLNERK